LDQDCPWVTEIAGSKATDKRGLLYLEDQGRSLEEAAFQQSIEIKR
jgi:hypothetical protein